MNIYNKKKPYIKITSFFALSLNGYDMHSHAHSSFEIMYVTKGNCLVYVENEKYSLTEEEYILIAADTPHKLFIPENQRCSIMNVEFCFSEKTSSIYMKELEQVSGKYRNFCSLEQKMIILQDNMKFGLAMKDLVVHLEKKIRKPQIPAMPFDDAEKMEYDYMTSLLFKRMVLELCDCEKRNDMTGTAYVQKACAYIEEHLTEELRVANIALAAGINKSYLHALFQEQLHCTIVEYINRKRLKQAAFLLLYSNSSVTDIAFQVGYNSRQHFANRFALFYGESPANYRNLYHKKELLSKDINGKTHD